MTNGVAFVIAVKASATEPVAGSRQLLARHTFAARQSNSGLAPSAIGLMSVSVLIPSNRFDRHVAARSRAAPTPLIEAVVLPTAADGCTRLRALSPAAVPGNDIRLSSELETLVAGSSDGGLFIMIGRKLEYHGAGPSDRGVHVAHRCRSGASPGTARNSGSCP
jgi:hypothetical protein